MNEGNNMAWDRARNSTGVKSPMEGNEMNVFVQTHSGEDGDSFNGENSDRRKSGFRHYVEESTLRNISLDELEELSDAGCITGIDGNIGRTPSSISSEQAPIRFAVILEWNRGYLNTPEFLLRFSLLVCSLISLVFITNAGTNEMDILNFSFSPSIRAHMFVTIFSLLATIAFTFLGVTTLVECFPPYWNFFDAALHGSLSMLFIFTSTILLHVEHESWQNVTPITSWTKIHLSLSAVFGFLCTLVCVFLVLLRCIKSRESAAPENIVLSSLRSS